jgi:RNA polymerase sigma-70 factor (ECF subfamily)
MRDSSNVEDLLHDVFLKASEKIHTVKSQGSIPGWLYRIASNTIADHYRAQQRFEEIPDDLSLPEADRNYVVELAECIRPFIATLPEGYREAITLSEIDGLPQREVAERLGISHSGAKSRVQRAREQLRQRVLECCDVQIGRDGILGYEPRGTACGCN